MAKKHKAKKPSKVSAKKSASKKTTAKKAAKKPAKSAKTTAVKAKSKATAAKPARAAKPAQAAKPAKAVAKPAKAKPAKVAKTTAADHDRDHGHDHDHDHGDDVQPAIGELAGKAMIVQILGDAEAYFLDYSKLSAERRAELIDHHLAAFARRKQAEGKDDWADHFVPLALLGESMPPRIRAKFDLSAPHEGLLVFHPQTGALLYAASKDDDKLAVLAPDIAAISPHGSFVAETFDPEAQSYAYTVDRSNSQGFTLGEIEALMQTNGLALTLV